MSASRPNYPETRELLLVYTGLQDHLVTLRWMEAGMSMGVATQKLMIYTIRAFLREQERRMTKEVEDAFRAQRRKS